MGWLHVLNSTSKKPTRNHFSTWEHSLGADAIAAALLDKHDVMMSFTRIKQIDIKSDKAIFGDIRVTGLLLYYQRHQSGWNRFVTCQRFYFSASSGDVRRMVLPRQQRIGEALGTKKRLRKKTKQIKKHNCSC